MLWDWSSDNDVFSFPSTVTRYLCLSSIISSIIYLWSYFKHPPPSPPLSVSPRCGSAHLWPSLLCSAVLMKMSRGVDGLFTTIALRCLLLNFTQISSKYFLFEPVEKMLFNIKKCIWCWRIDERPKHFLWHCICIVNKPICHKIKFFLNCK